MTIADSLDLVEAATRRMLSTAVELDGEAFAEPSLLPGWTRGHVAAHIARNADGLRNLLLQARTGEPVAMYASRETRAADIDAGARRPAAVHHDDLAASAMRFRVESESYPDDMWNREFRFDVTDLDSSGAPAHALLRARLFEVEVHHVDLATAYTFADTPVDLIAGFMDRVVGFLADEDLSITATATDLRQSWTLGAGSSEVTGPAHGLLAWLSGRSAGEGLSGQLPIVPSI